MCVCVCVCVYVRVCVCVCVCHIEKKVPDEWQARQAILAIQVVVEKEKETQYTGPGHGIDAHVADRARLHARVYNCTTQLQGVLDNESFDLVPSHAGE